MRPMPSFLGKRSLKAWVDARGRRNILVPWLINVLHNVTLNLRALPDRFSDGASDFREEAPIGIAQSAPYNDQELNFFIRVALEQRYHFIIELGAFSLTRCRKMAEVLPGVKVYGLDIGRGFEEVRTIDGVTIGPNTPGSIARIVATNQGRGLICTRGTLCYYAEVDLQRLITDAFERRLDLAISEPNTVCEASLIHPWRRTRLTWYQPYLHFLNDAGYQLPDNGGRQIRCCGSDLGETRTFVYARHPLNFALMPRS